MDEAPAPQPPPQTRTPGPMLRQRRRVIRGVPPVAVPSFFTLMNLLSGFFSLIQTSAGNLEAAAWLVVLAAFFDLLDGLMARLARVSSDFGLELDSLSDVVSFGVAPSFLLYEFGLDQLGPLWGAILASLPALFGAVRLARFNTLADPEEKQGYFTGLPIPAQAGTVVVFILTFADSSWFDVLERRQISVLITLVLALSALMVSPVRFPALPQPNRSNLRAYPYRFLAFGVGLVLTLVGEVVFRAGEVGLLISAVVYLALGIGGAIRWAISAASEPDDASPDR
ncbi:MAG: CDP-diacylglycerol--serine O-phosphatidyltransferase [Bacteroidota bacterium]